ncbi:CoA:oxalate CoA-transferase [Burkholderia plantarii]|uniref:CoA:oxalate CoA-transferase n=1 Tax=Burkholderia plantarii TaxID=41899 RepID=UPI0008707418|nr:CoA:oxalate CoA-transferase [Burkholderia plantarii]WLE62474.1 CoA:oxalate CoA-transferase [Burkholderia plantarii]
MTFSSDNTGRRAGPFSNLLVIDLTHVLNGPFGTSILADLGARVIKVEQPGHGDDTRLYGPFVQDQSLYFSFVNRGKESVVLDLKDEADRTIFLNMVRRADVLAENFRPGTMQRLGFSYETLSALNPRLVYASSSGFGQTGPMATYPAYDTIVQAMSGIVDATGFPDGPPTRVGTSLSDLCGGLYLFSGIASALYDRERTGRGTHVDVAMFDATLAFLEHGFMSYVATGRAPGRIGNRHPYMAPFDIYEARDRPLVICAGNDALFLKLCEALGRPGLAADPRFAGNHERMEHADALRRELEASLRERDAAHWLRVIHEAGVPVGPLLDIAEAAALPQTAARNMLIEAGGIRMPGNPLKLGGYDDPAVRPGAPSLDQHGEALRSEFATRKPAW